MICFLFLLSYAIVIDTAHFDGGTIRWIPIGPYANSSSITISIIQSYWWTYPTITCANNVPISTSGRSSANSNLTCVTDCSTDGGYSTKPINILTDCISVSTSLGMLTSQRSVNISLLSGAHFYLAYVGSAWRPLNSPSQSGLEWSILSFIDLRMRPDGFINTPPVASVASPQFAIVNITTEIQISVSDINTGDDVRCRWSTYTPGYRRRKRFDEQEHIPREHTAQLYKTIVKNEEIGLNRNKRGPCGGGGGSGICLTTCIVGCYCTCSTCDSATCTGARCTLASGCPKGPTTIDTPGTLQSTSSYPHRDAIDECGGICYPSSVPSGTTLSNCTLSFKGLASNTWYAIAIQVEDFFDTKSTTPMSSVPVQFLIYVLPQPTCSNAPIILPLTQCLEVTVGVSNSFNLSVLNLCNPSVVGILDIIVPQGITGTQISNLTISSTNASIVYKTFTWTPQTSQIGSQQLCAIAYTSEQLQSAEYCVTFIVITSLNVCGTTTTSTSATVSVTSTGAMVTSMITTTGNSAATNTMSPTTTSETPAATAKNTSGDKLYWGLIAGLSLLGLILLLLFSYCCCVYCCSWRPAAKRRRQEQEEEEQWQHRYLSSPTKYMAETSPYTAQNLRMQVPNTNYQAYNVVFKPNYIKTSYMVTKSNPIITTIPRWPLYGAPATVQNMPFLRLPVTTGEKVHN